MPYKSHHALLSYLDSPNTSAMEYPVLDLACGSGRSGLKLACRGIPVLFADRSAAALEKIRQKLLDGNLPGSLWQVDLEREGIDPFSHRVFSAVVCFRYLHRPLFPYLQMAVKPGGLVVYETFTTGNRRFGRPCNPDFLLGKGELRALFKNWEIKHYYEGIQHQPDRAIAQIVARKQTADV